MGRGVSRIPCLACCHRDQMPDKRIMDGWMLSKNSRQWSSFWCFLLQIRTTNFSFHPHRPIVILFNNTAIFFSQICVKAGLPTGNIRHLSSSLNAYLNLINAANKGIKLDYALLKSLLRSSLVCFWASPVSDIVPTLCSAHKHSVSQTSRCRQGLIYLKPRRSPTDFCFDVYQCNC